MSDTPIPRTLPTGPIPQVAYDAIIEEGWGDSVAQSLNNLNEAAFDSLTWPDLTDGSGTTARPAAAPTSSTMTTWLIVGNLYIPEWAVLDAFVQTSIEAVVEGTGGPNTYELQLSIGGITSARVCRYTAPVASGQWFTVYFTSLVPVASMSGPQEVQILARRVSGSGVWTASDETAVGVTPRYRGAVGWYGE